MTATVVRLKTSHRAAGRMLVAALVATTTGCATGYGTLAAAGAGAALGTIGTAVSASKGESVDGMYILEGGAAGALFGVIAAAVAASVGKKEGRQQALAEANRPKNAESYEERIQALEHALQERKRAPEHQAHDAPRYDVAAVKVGALSTSGHAARNHLCHSAAAIGGNGIATYVNTASSSRDGEQSAACGRA